MSLNKIREHFIEGEDKGKNFFDKRIAKAIGTGIVVASLVGCGKGGGNNNSTENTNISEDAATVEVIDDAVKNGEFDVKTMTGVDVFDETLKTDENGQIVLTKSQVDDLKTNINNEGLTDNDWIVFLSTGGSDNQGDIQGTFHLMLKVSDLNNLNGDETFRITPTSTFIKESLENSGNTDYSNQISNLVGEGNMGDINGDGNQDREDVMEYDPDSDDSDIETKVRDKNFLSNIRNGNNITADMVENVEASIGMRIKQIQDFPTIADKEGSSVSITLGDYIEGEGLSYTIKEDNTGGGFYIDSNDNLKGTHPSVNSETTNNLTLTASDNSNNNRNFTLPITTLDKADDMPLSINSINGKDIIEKGNTSTYSTKITDDDGILSSKFTLKDNNGNIIKTTSISPDSNGNVSYDLDTVSLGLTSGNYNLTFSAEGVDGGEGDKSGPKEKTKTVEVNEAPTQNISASSSDGNIEQNADLFGVDYAPRTARTIDFDLTGSSDVDGNITNMKIESNKRGVLYNGGNLTYSVGNGGLSDKEETLTFTITDDDRDKSKVEKTIFWYT